MAASFPSRYGPWAVIAGASEGLGAAFADALAARGHHLVLMARRKEVLEEQAALLTKKHGVEVRLLACDLADASFVEKLQSTTAGLDVGVAVYNAAYSFIAPMLTRPLEDALRVVDVNCMGPLRFVHALAPGMVQRKRGAIVLMASVAGFQGSPTLSVYAASKAFNMVLGESLWAELRPQGVDVVTSCAGAIRTPNYQKTSMKEAPGIMDPADVVEKTLAALGGGPIVVPGAINKLAAFFLRRVLTRKGAVELIAKSTSDLGSKEPA